VELSLFKANWEISHKILPVRVDKLRFHNYNKGAVVEDLEDPFVSITELAKAAGVTSDNIRQLLLRGTLQGRKRGSFWVIHKDEARRYLERRKGRKRARFEGKRRT
jgi:hypothetical protein